MKARASKTPPNLPPPLNVDNEEQAYKCDICSVSFKSDLDSTRHISSPTHIKNKESFLAVQNLNQLVEKKIPTNLPMVFDSLKLRSVKDLKDLADKGYFDIYDETTADIADELSTVLYKSVMEHDSKVLNPATRKYILDRLNQETEKRGNVIQAGSKDKNK